MCYQKLYYKGKEEGDSEYVKLNYIRIASSEFDEEERVVHNRLTMVLLCIFGAKHFGSQYFGAVEEAIGLRKKRRTKATQ